MILVSDLIAKFQHALDEGWGYIMNTAGEMWTLEKQNKATRKQTIEFGRQWIGHRVADCSGLFSWAFKQLGGYMYHGSNTMYRSYCSDKGRLANGLKEDGMSILPGTAVFTGTESDRGHVGLYIGGGEVIEARGTKAGVIKGSLLDKKWTWWGELKGVSYVEGGDEPMPGQKPTLKKGDQGAYVKEAQTALIGKGYDCGKWGADGKFGSATEDAVKRFQLNHGLTTDGVIGPATWEALEDDAPVTILYTVSIPHLAEYQADALLERYPGSSKIKEMR